jgi:hypothetical protein
MDNNSSIFIKVPICGDPGRCKLSYSYHCALLGTEKILSVPVLTNSQAQCALSPCAVTTVSEHGFNLRQWLTVRERADPLRQGHQFANQDVR